MGITRRKFLGASAVAVVAAGGRAKGKVFGANDRIQIAMVGIHGQGGGHMKNCLDMPDDVDVVALCDVDQRVLDGRVAQAKKASGKAPKAYRDVRDLLADDRIDAVTFATPNHWHTLGSVWACAAGKDVYVEKPLSHSVWEGRQVVEAAKKYGRIVQHGTQQRSDPTMMRDIQLMHEGLIGKIVHSRGYVYKNGNRKTIGFKEPKAPPAHLDWNLWQGPAQERPYCDNYVHYNWHWFWDYGNGEIGNQGVHEMDVAVWGHNRGLPVKVYSAGGRYAWEDQAETPNTQATTFTYADGTMLTFAVRNLGSFPEGNEANCSNSFFGTEGYYVQHKGFFRYKPNEPIPVDRVKPESQGKWRNFFKAIRSRKAEDIQGNATQGHLSCAHIHIGNIAYRLGRSLEFDPKTERFINDDEANAMLKRDYREPFTVPELA